MEGGRVHPCVLGFVRVQGRRQPECLETRHVQDFGGEVSIHSSSRAACSQWSSLSHLTLGGLHARGNAGAETGSAHMVSARVRGPREYLASFVVQLQKELHAACHQEGLQVCAWGVKVIK